MELPGPGGLDGEREYVLYDDGDDADTPLLRLLSARGAGSSSGSGSGSGSGAGDGDGTYKPHSHAYAHAPAPADVYVSQHSSDSDEENEEERRHLENLQDCAWAGASGSIDARAGAAAKRGVHGKEEEEGKEEDEEGEKDEEGEEDEDEDEERRHRENVLSCYHWALTSLDPTASTSTSTGTGTGTGTGKDSGATSGTTTGVGYESPPPAQRKSGSVATYATGTGTATGANTGAGTSPRSPPMFSPPSSPGMGTGTGTGMGMGMGMGRGNLPIPPAIHTGTCAGKGTRAQGERERGEEKGSEKEKERENEAEREKGRERSQSGDAPLDVLALLTQGGRGLATIRSTVRRQMLAGGTLSPTNQLGPRRGISMSHSVLPSSAQSSTMLLQVAQNIDTVAEPIEALRVLLDDLHVDPRVTDANGCTALHFLFNLPALGRLLIARGACVLQEDLQGDSPLSLALEVCNTCSARDVVLCPVSCVLCPVSCVLCHVCTMSRRPRAHLPPSPPAVLQMVLLRRQPW